MTGLSVGIVVIHHKSLETVTRVIKALLQQDMRIDELIVVDDYSQGGEPAHLRELFAGVRVIETQANVGLSRARNIGLENISSDLVLFIDDDMYLAPGALTKMVRAMRQDPASVVCPRIILYPESDVIQCDGALVHFVGTLALRHSRWPLSQHPAICSEVNAFTGACLLFDRNALASLGGFDDDYVFYFEDLELSYRLRALGYRVTCEENAHALHDRGTGTANLSFRDSGPYPSRRAYLNLRNRWRTICIHYQARTLLLLSPALLIYETVAFLECVRRGWGLLWVRAIFSLLGKSADIAHRRQRWKAMRKVSDGLILHGGALPFAAGFISGRLANALVTGLNHVLNAYWNLAKRWL